MKEQMKEAFLEFMKADCQFEDGYSLTENVFNAGYQAALAANAKQIIQEDIAKGIYAHWSRNDISGNGKESAVPAQEPAKLKHHPICDGRYPSLCDACNAEAKQPAQEPALPKATIMPSTLKEPIQVPVSEPTALSVSWHVSKQPAPEPVKQESKWLPIETAPKNTKIIVRYKNEYGNDKTVFAKYIEKFTEEASCDSENDEYDEATDTYYLKEGWLELIENWDEFSSVYFDSRNIVTGWMPAPPVEVKE